MEYIANLYKSKQESEKQIAYWEKYKYDSPITLNHYLDAIENNIKIKCHIERVESENKRYGEVSMFASPFRKIGGIETPEGEKVGLHKNSQINK